MLNSALLREKRNGDERRNSPEPHIANTSLAHLPSSSYYYSFSSLYCSTVQYVLRPPGLRSGNGEREKEWEKLINCHATGADDTRLNPYCPPQHLLTACNLNFGAKCIWYGMQSTVRWCAFQFLFCTYSVLQMDSKGALCRVGWVASFLCIFKPTYFLAVCPLGLKNVSYAEDKNLPP